MGFRGLKFSLAVVLLTALLVLSALSAAKAKTDQELKRCKHQCKHQERFTGRQQEECEQRCEEYYKQMERERGRGGRGEEELQGDDKRKQLKDCRKQCEGQEGSYQQKQACRARCEERFGEKEMKPWSREEERRVWGNLFFIAFYAF